MPSPASVQWALDLYHFLLREFREPDEASGEVVTRDVRPHFNALCEFIAENTTEAF